LRLVLARFANAVQRVVGQGQRVAGGIIAPILTKCGAVHG
jgi:hypothetical protein